MRAGPRPDTALYDPRRRASARDGSPAPCRARRCRARRLWHRVRRARVGGVEPLEREALKARFDVRGPERADGLLVVGIDADSFDALPQQSWPFTRSVHGRVVRRLHAAGARLIVYDVQFTEPTVPREDLAAYNALGA